jgi:hypothetical protein
MSDFSAGFFAGATGVAVSHPFDTIKTMYQMDTTKKYKNVGQCTKAIFRQGFLRFYKGVYPPLFGVGLEKCIVFGSYNTVQQYTKNIFLSGVAAGLCCTIVVTPIEKIKILQQQETVESIKNNNGKITALNVIKKHGFKGLYCGWSATLGREVPGFGIYFSTYEFLKEKQKYIVETNNIIKSANTYGLLPFFNGSLSGAAAWLFIYPSDPVKTLMQTNNVGLGSAIKQIYGNSGINGFYKGFGLGLFRAIPLHGGVFAGYEIYKRLFH